MEVSGIFSPVLPESTAEFTVGVIDSSREIAAAMCSLNSIHQDCSFTKIMRLLETQSKTLQRLESLILADKSLDFVTSDSITAESKLIHDTDAMGEMESTDSEVKSESESFESDFGIGAHIVGDTGFGKIVASTSNIEIQKVRPLILTTNQEEAPLGYRGISDILESHNGLLKKVELPAFTGKYPSIWINRAERFSRLGNYTDQDKFDLISVNFEGAVLSWFITEKVADPFRDWDDFKRRVVKQYHTVKSSSPVAGNLTNESKSQTNVALEIEVVQKTVATAELHVSVQAQELQKTNDRLPSALLLKSELISSLEEGHEADWVQMTKMPLVEENSEKNGESTPYTMKPWCFDDMISSEERNLIPYLSIIVNEVEETVDIVLIWSGISRTEGEDQMFSNLSQHKEQYTTKKKLKNCFKSRRFKFKNESGIRKAKYSRSAVIQHHTISSLKRWKYDWSVWHCWRNKTLQRIKFRKVQRHIEPFHVCGFRVCVISFQQEFQPLFKNRLMAVTVQQQHKMWPEQKGVLKLVDGLVVDSISDADQDELMYEVAAARRVLCILLPLQVHRKRQQRKDPKSWNYKFKNGSNRSVLVQEKLWLTEKRTDNVNTLLISSELAAFCMMESQALDFDLGPLLIQTQQPATHFSYRVSVSEQLHSRDEKMLAVSDLIMLALEHNTNLLRIRVQQIQKRERCYKTYMFKYKQKPTNKGVWTEKRQNIIHGIDVSGEVGTLGSKAYEELGANTSNRYTSNFVSIGLYPCCTFIFRNDWSIHSSNTVLQFLLHFFFHWLNHEHTVCWIDYASVQGNLNHIMSCYLGRGLDVISDKEAASLSFKIKLETLLKEFDAFLAQVTAHCFKTQQDLGSTVVTLRGYIARQTIVVQQSWLRGMVGELVAVLACETWQRVLAKTEAVIMLNFLLWIISLTQKYMTKPLTIAFDEASDPTPAYVRMMIQFSTGQLEGKLYVGRGVLIRHDQLRVGELTWLYCWLVRNEASGWKEGFAVISELH